MGGKAIGGPAIDPADAKAALRRDRWGALQRAGVARFPGAVGRIPNFVGADAAAGNLASTAEWMRARRVKCNPDTPQRPVRHAALKAGKILYVPAPKLAEQVPFLKLNPARLRRDQLWRASSIRGAAELGRPVAAHEVGELDLIVTGCVAVSRRGGRLGKGGGYSDLEYAILRELGHVDEATPVATTVHSLQVVPAASLPMTEHDVSVDLVATEKRVIRCLHRLPRPQGLLWDEITEDQLEAIPSLRRRAARRGERHRRAQ